jgi:hypothetical protein
MTYILLIVALVLLAVDWLQTVTIARNPGRWFERNPVILWWMRLAVDRLHLPEVGVHVHFALSAVLIVGMACVIAWLWPRHLIGWAVLWVAVEGWMVRNNYRLGIKPASI